MRAIMIVSVMALVCCFVPTELAAQECTSLQNSTPDELVSYLAGTLPNDGNAHCVTFAIKALIQRRYDPAIAVLAKLLDFRRPLNARERAHVFLHPPITEEMYPAANALEEIGKKSLPAVLAVIKSSPSATARENAVSVWMEIYKYESPKGVAPLKQQASKAPVPMHPVLAGFLMAWRERTPYAKDGDFVFPSFRLKGKKPLSASIMVQKYLRPAAIRLASAKKTSEFASGFTTSGIRWLLRW